VARYGEAIKTVWRICAALQHLREKYLREKYREKEREKQEGKYRLWTVRTIHRSWVGRLMGF